jgi:hypothetical protein
VKKENGSDGGGGRAGGGGGCEAGAAPNVGLGATLLLEMNSTSGSSSRLMISFGYRGALEALSPNVRYPNGGSVKDGGNSFLRVGGATFWRGLDLGESPVRSMISGMTCGVSRKNSLGLWRGGGMNDPDEEAPKLY